MTSRLILQDQVWAIDITYIPWRRGHVYLTAIIDWHTRAVLAWKVSNTMEVDSGSEALKEAVAVAGRPPEDPQHRSRQPIHGDKWLRAVESMNRVSMDGKGRWMDNVIIERLWRSVKHEWVLLHEYNTLPELNALLEEWIERYNMATAHGQRRTNAQVFPLPRSPARIRTRRTGLERRRNFHAFGQGLKHENFCNLPHNRT
ncbi:MAG: integrase core domain-containing protein [Verrucomicrobiales bacterium]